MGRRTGLSGLATATSMVAATMASTSTTVRAQEALPSLQVAQGESPRSFDIPPQSLSSALVQFGQQAGRHLTVDGNLVRNLATPGVRGTMPAEEALHRLLAGTNLTFSGAAGGTITVHQLDRPGGAGAMQLDPVQVQGAFMPPSQAMIDNAPPPYAGGQVATGGQLGLLGNRDVMDTPFNTTSYTAKKAQDQQAKTVQEALIDDPSVRTLRADYAPGADGVYIRGFPVNKTSISYGGLYGILPSFSIMAELADRIEVLNGPNAMLNGMSPGGDIGGAINIVPKRAPNEPLTQFTANYISGTQFGGHVDVGRRFGPDGQFGVRFNGVFRGGQTDLQWLTDERALGLLGLDFRGDRARFSVDFGDQYQYIGGVPAALGLNTGVPLPWVPNVRNNPVGQPWGFSEKKDLFGVLRGEVDLTDYLTAYVSIGAHDSRIQGLYPQFARITDFNGNAILSTLNYSQYSTYRTAEGGLRAIARTGPIEHQLAFTATTYDVETGVGFVAGTAFATNIYNPTVIARPNLVTPIANKSSTTSLSSLGLADTLSAAEKRIQLTVGGRLQRVTEAGFDTTTGLQTSSYDASAFSPSVSLVVKPFWQNVTLYANWIQGLQPGTIVQPPLTNAGEVLPPYKATQYETGVKIDWGKFTTTANVFQITLPSTVTDLASNTLTLNGEQRNQGLEFNFFGEPTQGVRLLGGAMFLNPVLTRTAGGTNDGWIAPYSPQLTLNLAGEWDLPFVHGLTATGRAIYTASQYIDTAWPRRSLSEWTRFDLGARYAFENPGAKGKMLVARFNVENILDTNYWSGAGTGGLFLGMPRTFRLSLSADF